MTEFLQQEKVTVLPLPPYSPDLNPCDYFLFPPLKKLLAGRKVSRRCFVGSAVFQCLKGIPTKDYENAFRMWIKRLQLCIKYQGKYFEGMKSEGKLVQIEVSLSTLLLPHLWRLCVLITLPLKDPKGDLKKKSC